MQPMAVHGDLMQRALTVARDADVDIPIGAIVVDRAGSVIGAAHNEREVSGDPTAHAEVLALRQAAKEIGSWRLDECTLVVTMEPCPMCAGAAINARIASVIFGAYNDDYGAAGSAWDLLRDRRMHHRPDVIGGILAEECGRLVTDFMAAQRLPGVQ